MKLDDFLLPVKPRVSAKPGIDELVCDWRNRLTRGTVSQLRIPLPHLIATLMEQHRFHPAVDKALTFMKVQSPVDYFWQQMEFNELVVFEIVMSQTSRATFDCVELVIRSWIQSSPPATSSASFVPFTPTWAPSGQLRQDQGVKHNVNTAIQEGTNYIRAMILKGPE